MKNCTSLFFILIVISLSFSCQSIEKKPLTLNPLFSDNMVLQQNEGVAIWGEYTPGKEVTITADWGSSQHSTTDENGNWEIRLQTPEAGGPYTISFETADSTIALNDVLMGEVWLASGQSNMEMPLKGWPPGDPILNSASEIAAANYPEIRMFTVARNLSDAPIEDFDGAWVAASAETAADFSATAYFFARRLHQELNVPIGIIHSSWGGTPAEAWTSDERLRTLGDFDEVLDNLVGSEAQSKTEAWFEKWHTVSMPNAEEAWQSISFSDTDFAETEYNDSQWESIELPGRFDQINGKSVDGAFWLRNTFNIESTDTDYVLEMGAIDDMDATFINGTKVGGLAGPGFWNVPRKMTIPKSLLKTGSNTIAIRAIDTGGPGSLSGPISISNPEGVIISMEGSWKTRLIAEIYQGEFYIYDAEADLAARPDVFQFHSNLPTVLFNAMIHPLVPYTIKGAIWYQGESNVGRDEQYKTLFPAMISDWREQWESDFPFYFVQIAPFRYTPNPDQQVSQKLRDAQRHALKTANTGMVVTLDIGNPVNIHPGNKQDVGKRLAGLALANDYGKDIIASGPLYNGVEISGNKMIVNFDYVGDGLMTNDPELSGFEIAGADKNYVAGMAVITGDKVEVHYPSIDSPAFVRYAWKDTSVASLFNAAGLPASSFSSEDQ